MFLIDFEQGRLVADEELKSDFSSRRPYGDWLRSNRIELADLPASRDVPGLDAETLLPRMQAFGYTLETIEFMLLPMVAHQRDPLGSMGNDSGVACLSDVSRASSTITSGSCSRR